MSRLYYPLNVDDNQAREMKLLALHMDLEDMRKAQADPSNSHNYEMLIKNTCFLIDFYKKGGDLPPPRGIRWVANGQFLEVDGDWPKPFDTWAHTSDAGLNRYCQFSNGAAFPMPMLSGTIP